ncbi:MAG: hypothetical protein ABIF80_01770 [Patescibacteria group bacterium]
MIFLIGVEHSLQLNWCQHNTDQVAKKAYLNNLEHYLPLLREIFNKYSFVWAGEESGTGMTMKELLAENGVKSTFLQQIINQSSTNYFQFDIPRTELSKYGVKNDFYNIRKNKDKIPNKVREEWFVKIINMKIQKDEDGLIILGADHMKFVRRQLTTAGYIINIDSLDVTKLEWYQDPGKVALANFFKGVNIVK